MTKKALALFDFDGTITVDDSLLGFIRHFVGDGRFLAGMALLAPMLLLYKAGVIPNYKAKQMLLAHFFRGMSQKRFYEIASRYSLHHIDKITRPQAMERIAWHKDMGHTVVVVSASIECWLRPWCDKNGLELLATKLEIKDEVITGNFLTQNCYGDEKVRRIKEAYDLSLFEYIYAYGDSKGDEAMLGIADEAHYKAFSLTFSAVKGRRLSSLNQ